MVQISNPILPQSSPGPAEAANVGVSPPDTGRKAGNSSFPAVLSQQKGESGSPEEGLDESSGEEAGFLPFPLFMFTDSGMALPQSGTAGGNDLPPAMPKSLVEAMRLALADAKGGNAKIENPSGPGGGDVASLIADVVNSAMAGDEGDVDAFFSTPMAQLAEAGVFGLSDKIVSGEHLLSSSTAMTAIDATFGAPLGRLKADMEGLISKTGLPDIDMPVEHKGWGKALGERLLFMVGHKVQAAEVRLNPPDLGPVEIRISLQNDQASVSFTAHHAVTREALEAAVPRLREMLGEQNLNLVNVDVGQRHAHEGAQDSGQMFGGTPSDAGGALLAEGDDVARFSEETSSRTLGRGLVDDYA